MHTGMYVCKNTRNQIAFMYVHKLQVYVCMYIYDHILHLLTNRAVSAPQGEAREVPRKPIRGESGLLGQNSHLPG